MQRGAFPHAASAFAANLKAERGSFSVQILVACSTETIQKAVDNVPSQELFILTVNYKGKSCYRVCWGVFDSEGRAVSALHSLPDYFVKGGATPKVAPLASLLP
jgi:septal ring-binding cell division protein DamX